MHSSSMHTARSLTMMEVGLPAPRGEGRVPTPGGGVCSWGVGVPCDLSHHAFDVTSGRTQVLYKAHVLYCALFSWSCFFFSGNC